MHAAQEFDVQLTASHDVVKPREIFVYSLTVRNHGNALTDATVILSLHEDLDVEFASDDGSERRGGVEWKNLTFAAGEQRSLTASVRVDDGAEDGALLSATALVGGSFDDVSVRVEDDDDPNNDDERPVTIELFSDKPQVEPGESFTFVVTLINHSSRRVNDVDAIVELDDKLRFLSASHRGKGSDENIEWSSLDLQANEKRTVTASVQVGNSAEHGESLLSTAHAEGAVYEHKLRIWDPDFSVEQLKLSAFADKQEVTPGGTIMYTLRVRNLADHEEHVTIEAYLDPATTFESASEGGLQFEQSLAVWEKIAFAQSETKSFTLSARAAESAQPGTAVRLGIMAGIDRREIVTAVVMPPPQKSATGETLLGNLSAGQRSGQETATQPNIELTRRADKDEVQPGSTVTFALHIRNLGEETLRDISVTDHFPPGAVQVSDVGRATVHSGSIRWAITQLRPREQWSATYQVRVAEDLEHGDEIQTSSEITVGERVIEQRTTTTNVITQLPQAGQIPIVSAFVYAGAALQPVENAGAFEARENKSDEQNSQEHTSIAWLIALTLSACIGIGAGIRWPRQHY